MKVNEGKKKRGIDPDALGIWEGCGGVWYTRGSVCRECGKTRADHRAGGLSPAKPERDLKSALDFRPSLQIPLPGIGRNCRIVITRGYGSAGPLDNDNLLGGLKALRDQITAQILGRDSDAEKDGIVWEYRQVRGKGVKVEIFALPEGEALKE